MKKLSKNEMQKQYQNEVDGIVPKPPVIKNILWAFCVGGLICCIGQVVQNYFLDGGLIKKDAAAATSSVMVFLGAF